MKKRVCLDCMHEEKATGSSGTGKSCNKCKSTNVYDLLDKEHQVARSNNPPKNENQPLRVSWFNSLQFRFGGALILITMVILGGFTIYEYSNSKNESLRNLQQLAEIASNRMSKYLVEPLWGVEDEQLSESIVSEMMDQQINSIIITDNDTNSAIIGKKRDINGALIDTHHVTGNNLIRSVRPIVRHDDIIGKVEVTVTSDIALQKLEKAIVKFVSTTFFLCIVILATVFLILRTLILNPIKFITNAAEKMSLGELDVKIPHQPKNEIGFLVDAIQRMQSSLKIAFKMLSKT